MTTSILYAAFDPVPFPKGAATRIAATVRALTRAGARVTLLTPQAPPVPGFAPRLEGLDHRPVVLQADNFLDRALAFRAHVAETLAGEAWDACWVRSPWEGVPAARTGMPVVYEVHGFPSVELPAHFPRLREHPELLGRFVEEELLLLSRARHFVTPSQLGLRYLHSRGVRPERVHVIPNSVDRFPPPRDRPEGPFRALYAGTLAPWQGLDTLLEALALLKGRLDLKVRLAGTRKGPWLRQLRRHAQHLRVRSLLEVLGPLDPAALDEETSRADVCLAPLPDNARNSLQGCCPVKILEYMAAGRPVLSTRIPAVEELLIHGKTGWLVRPGSPRALADGLRWLVDHPAEAAGLGAQARVSVAERFSRAGFDAAVARFLASISL